MAVTDIVITAGGILVYALIVNAFYQRISKRVMIARLSDRVSEEDARDAMRRAKASAEETHEVAKAAEEGEATGAEVREVAAEAREAVAEARQETQRASRRPAWKRFGVHFLVFVPLTLVYFGLLATNLLVLSATEVAVVVNLAMATVLAVRAAAYLSEPTSHDLAKMLPLALLGFVLLQGGAVGIAEVRESMSDVVQAWPTIAQAMVVLLVVEVGMAIAYSVWQRFGQKTLESLRIRS